VAYPAGLGHKGDGGLSLSPEGYTRFFLLPVFRKRKHRPVRSVLTAEINGPKYGVVRIVIEADGFLRHMVRNIVGTVVEAGLGKISPERFKEIIDLQDRQLAGVKAPPQGFVFSESKVLVFCVIFF